MRYEIDRNSGIPLIGHPAFGIEYRDTNFVEVRPLSGCNISCTFCSVDQGPKTKTRVNNYIVDKDYLVQYFKMVRDLVPGKVEAFLSSQGEVMLYKDLIPLIKDLSEFKKVGVTVQTNGTLLKESFIDEVKDYVSKINVSLNAISKEKADMLAQANYPVKKVKKMIEYGVNQGVDMVLTPVLVPGQNEKEIKKVVEFGKSLPPNKKWPRFGIQNFLEYKYGRKPTKSWGWKKFNKYLKDLEKETGADLLMEDIDFGIKPAPKLIPPFKEGEKIKAKIKLPGMLKNEMIGVAKGRAISIRGLKNESLNKEISVKITSTKYNMIVAKDTRRKKINTFSF